ncbi:MAG: hypothetical protein IPL32_19960 [Chloracidobacterium sp.]|nr:hypothetical protein [Chloracidobacterium sp.]
MQRLQDMTFISVTPPAAIVDNAAFTTATIDTYGYDEMMIVAYFGAMDIAMAALKVQESDASNMSGAADVSGADFSVSPATLPSATADNTAFQVHVKCGGSRKRYLDLSATGGDGTSGTFLCVFAFGAKAEVKPSSATLRGFNQALSV